MKARWTLKCECCKVPIPVGAQYVMHAGRPWRTDHLIEYKKRRRQRR